MFQSFTGSSRRPRQVNLSGQNNDPFAATSWAPTASGTQKTVAAAQLERQQRQLERDRLNATKIIQRTWRGHRTRKELADAHRREWDEIYVARSFPSLPVELQLILAFFSPHNSQDIHRLEQFSQRVLQQDPRLSNPRISQYVPKLANFVLQSIKAQDGPSEILQLFLTAIAGSYPQLLSRIVPRYYDALSSQLMATLSNKQRQIMLSAIETPLIEHVDSPSSRAIVLSAYRAFAFHLLTTPHLKDALGGMEELALRVDIELLSEALVDATLHLTNEIRPNLRLWLLAHLIHIHRLQEGSSQRPMYMRALSTLLSSSANEIVGRVDQNESIVSAEEDDHDPELPIPSFIREELITLVNKASISGLLEKFDSTNDNDEDASLLASYALILLRVFPRLGEEIRMWLYQGSIRLANSGVKVPAVKIFWQAMHSTRTFLAICNDFKCALQILRPSLSSRRSLNLSPDDLSRHRDWRAILLFLELYAFVLRFTDDEEFLNGGSESITDPDHVISRSRESALPLQDVKLLTMFLKNLSFTMFFYAPDLTEDENPDQNVGLGSYFGTSRSNHITNSPKSTSPTQSTPGYLGMSGMTFLYVRGIVTRVMRMLYERDSRRRFLPKDHWLMTSRFDMDGFIPSVVMEEERRHQIAEGGNIDDDDDYDQLSTSPRSVIGMRTSRRHLHLENLRKQQERASRRKVLASVGPRLEVLQNMPFVIPFATRVQIFRQFVYQDQVRRRGGSVDPDSWRMSIAHGDLGGDHRTAREILNRHHAKIRRDNLFEDAFDEFYELGEGLKEPIQITFVDQFDTVEAGIDGGGVTKEFLTSVTNEAFRSSDGLNLFITNDQNLLYPNPTALDERRELLRQMGVLETSNEGRERLSLLLRQYEFLGRVVGKCLYEGILVDIGFAGFFLLKWASSSGSGSAQDGGYLANINDLRDLDESLYQGLLQLKNYPGNVEDFSLDFTIADTVSMPGEPTRTVTRDLLPNGSNISVTNENRVLYISGVARHRLHGQPFHQTRAFLRGLGDIINPSWLSMFNQNELQTLIGGDSSEIDVEDLRRNTAYSGVYVIGDDGEEHPTIRLFWNTMKELQDSDRRKVLKYVTSTPRAPLLGFSQLNPRFSIRDAGGDEQRLPSTSTCINLLKMPRYSTASTLKQKLLYAINSGAGFDLS